MIVEKTYGNAIKPLEVSCGRGFPTFAKRVSAVKKTDHHQPFDSVPISQKNIEYLKKCSPMSSKETSSPEMFDMDGRRSINSSLRDCLKKAIMAANFNEESANDILMIFLKEFMSTGLICGGEHEDLFCWEEILLVRVINVSLKNS